MVPASTLTVPSGKLTGSQPGHSLLDPTSMVENKVCPGCKKTVVTEDGSVVVAFGQSLFHVDCFKCAKCNNQVTADTNLLLLSDGSPVCANCSYCCNVCGLPILDEAIMTGDDAYHAHCFNCKVCKKRIDELVFAKTRQGIYCMDCHNERVARSRRHQQRRDKERTRDRPGTSDSVKSKDTVPREGSLDGRKGSLNSRSGSVRSKTLPTSGRPTDQSSVGSSQGMRRDSASSIGERLIKTQSPPPQIQQSVSLPPPTTTTMTTPPAATTTVESPDFISPVSSGSSSKRYSTMLLATHTSPSVTASSDSDKRVSPTTDHARSATLPPTNTLAVPFEDKTLQKRRSFNDRPLNVLLQENISEQGVSEHANGNGLLVPNGTASSRKDKRRSINPSLALAYTASQDSSHSPTTNSFARSHTPPVHGHGPSPRQEGFSISTSTTPTLSPPTLTDSPKSHPLTLSDGNNSNLNGRTRSASSGGFADPSRGMDPNASAPLRPPLRPSITLDRVPARTSSRVDLNSPSSSRYRPITPPDAGSGSGGRTTPQFSEGRGSPSPSTLGVPNGNGTSLRTQKPFEDRYHAHPNQNQNQRPGTGGSSSLRSSGGSSGQTIELPARSRSGSRPTSPSHRVDVPQGIESGTDTEAEVEVTRFNDRLDDDRPPVPPPKEPSPSAKPRPKSKSKVGMRPPELKLNTGTWGRGGGNGNGDGKDGDRDDASDLEIPNSEASSISQEESPVQQTTSHSTFIAPALPPIRFSMGAADFSDLLKSVNGPQPLKSLVEAKETKPDSSSGLKVDIKTAGSTRLNGRSPSTPTSDITVIDSDLGHASDVTPVKRRDPPTQRYNPDPDTTIRRERSPSRSPSPSPRSSQSSSNNHNNTNVYATLPRSSGNTIKRSLDVDRPVNGRSLDIPLARQRSFSAFSRGEQSRPSHQREKTEPSLANFLPTAPARITLTPADDLSSSTSSNAADPADLVKRRLQEAVADATARGSSHVKLDMEFVNAILMVVDQRSQEFSEMKNKLDGMKRASQQYMDGLTVAQTEFDKELRARRDAEAEVTRLRILLNGQAARLSAVSGESRRQEVQKALSRELSDSLSMLERDISKLKVERDMTLAEVEELSATKSSSAIGDGDADAETKLGRALSMRFDNIKNQYTDELLPLTQKRENLIREIEELKSSRDAFLEETTMLNARNEELAQLNAQYIRRLEASGIPVPIQERTSEEQKSHLVSSTTSSTVALTEESAESKFIKITKPEVPEQPTPQSKPRFIKWPGSKTTKENVYPEPNKQKPRAEHSFLQISVLRPARCDHCGNQMWGSQLRCSNCSIAVHTRCVHQVHLPCSQHTHGHREEASAVALKVSGPSLFGRDLIEQVHADWQDGDNFVPVIVEKCIDAVDLLGLEYEGIYRKTGGSRLSKLITQLFESGDYASFDLRDTDRFNDICSITSVLKSYLRMLPNPLLTFDLHHKFIAAATLNDPALKANLMSSLVQELPREHYHTLRALMLHLHRVCQRSEINLMHARNLGMVFGPTLMRSRDPNGDFTDMAGKSLSIEFLVENAPMVFSPPT